MKTALFFIGFVLLFLAILLLNINLGSFDTNFQTVFDSIFNYDSTNLSHFSIVNLRLPHILMAFCVGAVLAISGYLMQLVINNPLADPYILGTSSAASLGANLVFFGLLPITISGFYMPQVSAFVFAMLSTLAVMRLAKQKNSISGSKMLLAGVAISSLLTSIVAILAFLADSDEKLKTIIFWVMGSFEHAKWTDVALVFSVLIPTVFISLLFSNSLNMLLLGKDKASDLGLKSSYYYNSTLVGAVFLAALCVSLVGAVGFVGLMIPHIVRAIFGVTNRLNILYSALLGGLFMMFCDYISKLLYPPVGLPIGIITSLFGIPFFVYLLTKKNYTFE